MGTAVTDGAGSFLNLLTLEQPEPDLFRGISHEGAPLRAFGGQVAAHALVAATRTVDPDRPVHSLHSYFIRGGDTTIPIDYQVDRIRDGKSFTTRRITAVQRDEAIFVLSASFHRHEDSPIEHQRPAPRVQSPPDGQPLFDGRKPADSDHADPYDTDKRAEQRRAAWTRRGFEVRVVTGSGEGEPVDSDALFSSEPAPARMRAWLRVTEKLPDDQHTHACALVYMSDLTLSHSILGPHGGMASGMALTSLDHAVWFHRPFRADEWLLFDQASPTASVGRGLAVGEFFDTSGRLVASVVQEALARPHRHSR
ncbi:acyl-CoA thioesterase II [Frankia sp. CNm7]|uniref:Acyl-CoA thioesterase 2 n=1 Tax=Frankia nepalensis TaxID=1836974 RepID=A0A937RLM3_9ACTN|nr:acyl-CoA thioesterase II [Frankia nepalensis]MBL7497453.1 acyl-CoA thioesterase II [Frankia nepalensis]MBL7514703.1 acyl-CoA thioesterase II [Frankia nepalensis]MBL7524358.1 acyl-CoA thioesterase II [Frankia nepalensis]MBL7629589.1 acyl-CoA thioesterase II [Frankia nepalensis]